MIAAPRKAVEAGTTGRFRAAAAGLSLCAIVASPLAASAAGFTSTEGVTQIEVAGVTIDVNGFVWTADARGVCRYDGVTWRCPVSTPARAVAAGADGVWAALAGGTVVSARVDRPAVVVGTIPGDVRRMFARGRRLVVAASSGVYALDGDGGGALQRALDDAGRDAALTPEGALVVASGDRIIERRGGAAPHERARLPDPVAALAVEDGDASLWAGTDSGRIYVLRGGRPPLLIGDERGPVTALTPRSGGGVWAGSGDGLLEVDPRGAVRLITNKDGLPHNRITALAFDGARVLWVGTAGGLALQRLEHPLRNVTRADGLAGDTAFAVTTTRDGTVWSTTAFGVAALVPGPPLNLGPREGLPSVFDVRSIAVDRDGTLYVAGTSTGVYRLQDARATRVWPNVDKPGIGVRALRPRLAGGLWVGLDRGGLARMVGADVQTVLEPQASGRDRVFDVLEAHQRGDVLLALGRDGLAAWDGARLARFGKEHGLPNAEIVSLAPSATADALVASNGAGLLRLRGGRLSAVTAKQGLPDDHVFAAIEDGIGHTWVSTPAGVAAMATAQLDRAFDDSAFALSPRRFGTPEGVPGEPIRAYPPSAHLAPDGKVWFPTMRGLVAFDPRALDAPAPRSTLVIDDVQVDGHSLTAGVRRPARRVALVFAFAAPSYYPDAKGQIRHRLEGLPPPGNDWQPANGTTEARYQSVPPGRYRFRVQRSSAIPGRPADEATYELVLAPPWYDRRVVRLPAMLAFALALVALHRLRLRRLAQVHRAVLADRTRIARDIHDTLEQDLSGLRLQIDAAAMLLDRDLPRAREHLGRATELISDGVIDLRNAIWGLRSSAVSSRELARALRTRIDRLTSGTRYTVAVEELGPAVFLSPAQASHLVMAVREAVTNAIKHADATRISVSADTTSAGLLQVTVSDDGRGMDTPPAARVDEPAGGGHGMKSLHDRMAAVAGSVTVESSAAGTRVVLRVPNVRSRGEEA